MNSALKFSITLFFVIFSITSCSEPETVIPPEIISRDSMVTILADLHIAEARLMNSGPFLRDRMMKSIYLQNVLHKSNVDSARFLKSFDFYSEHPDVFSGMYEQVVVEISKRQAERQK